MAITTNQVRKILKRRRFAHVKFPKAIESSYKHRLSKIVNKWYNDYFKIVVIGLDPIRSQIRVDAWEDDLTLVIGQYESAVKATIPTATAVTLDAIQKVNIWNKRQWLRQLEQALGVPVFTTERVTDVNRLTAEKTVEYIKQNANDVVSGVKTSILSGIEQGLSTSDITKKVTEKASKTLDNTNTLATMTVSSLNTQLYKARHKDMNIDEYFWVTMNDAKVRSNHRPLHGMICRWDDPTVFKYTQDGKWLRRSSIGAVELEPGADYNCRCQAGANMSRIGVRYE